MVGHTTKIQKPVVYSCEDVRDLGQDTLQGPVTITRIFRFLKVKVIEPIKSDGTETTARGAQLYNEIKGKLLKPSGPDKLNQMISDPETVIVRRGSSAEFQGILKKLKVADVELKKQAANAEEKAGMLWEHSLAVQEYCQKKNIIICVRPVSREASDFIREGRGTKDMSIKAKSSNLPPLNALIPHDQSMGKKGYNEKVSQSLTRMNDEAIDAKRAKKVGLEISVDRLKWLKERTNRLEICGTLLDDQRGEGLLVGSDFDEEKKFYFWGVRDGQTLKIFHAKKRENDVGWDVGEQVQVMANRQGQAVTADYDLALVMVDLKDHGPKNNLPLPVTSYEEAARRKIAIGKDQKTFNEAVNKALSKNAEDYELDADLDGFKAEDIKTDEIENVMFAEIERISGKRVADEIRANTEEKSALLKLYMQDKRADLIQLGLISGQIPQKNLGITSTFVKNLIKDLNITTERGKGQEVFHHGEDTGNPFSEEDDNYPMTVILPSAAAQGGDVIRIVENTAELSVLLQTLKDLNYHTQMNERWDKKVSGIMRKNFIEALKAMEIKREPPGRRNAVFAGKGDFHKKIHLVGQENHEVLETTDVESMLLSHHAVSEAAVVAYPHGVNGQGIYCYVTLKSGYEGTDVLRADLVNYAHSEIGPNAILDKIQFAPGLPKNGAGMIIRPILRKIAENDLGALGDTSTLADPAVVDDLVANRQNKSA
jgi:hypothetical protein